MDHYEHLEKSLSISPKTWLITGVAGFIGSNLLETLLKLGQRVVGLDNFVTGYQHNLDEVQTLVSSEHWQNFQFIYGDIRQLADCENACTKVDYVLHQAALGSVPRSVADPIATNEANVCGFLNMLVAARDARVKSFTYAASSSTYGAHPGIPKREKYIGKPLSPYALTKYINELYADVFLRCYHFNSIGLRYFNVFGPRQDPNGAYAAVIPRWISSSINREKIYINGDGLTTRDFTYVENVVRANILAATCGEEFKNEIYNIATGKNISLNNLYEKIKILILKKGYSIAENPIYLDFRKGDVTHSLADISKAASLIKYVPTIRVSDGLERTVEWYLKCRVQEKLKKY